MVCDALEVLLCFYFLLDEHEYHTQSINFMS